VTVEDVLDQLERVKRNGAGWTARCPSHQDRNPSLSVGVGDDERIVLSCQAGCSTEAVVAALGLEMRDLFPEREGGSAAPSGARATGQRSGCTLAEFAAAKRLPAEFLRELGVAELTYLKRPAVRFAYLDEAGVEQAVRFRIAATGDDKFRWKSGSKAKGRLYGLSRLRHARELGYVTLVEGESDALTLWYHGRPAIALPGAAMWDESRNAGQLDGLAVYVVIEPDQGGEAMLGWLRGSAIRDRVRLVRLETKDVSELHLADETTFSGRFERALQAATPWTEHERVASDLQRSTAWKACATLARDPAILARFVEMLPHVGVVGEETAAKILFLALTSRLLAKPSSVVVKGPYAGGKSCVVENVLRYFPEEAYHALTAMSQHALAYSTEPLAHRHLVIYEAAALGEEFSDYLLRTLLSEGRLRYETVEKTAAGLEARLIEREGPTGLVMTTTAVTLHPENETRLISLTVSDTRDQTRSVFLALAEEDDLPSVDLAAWVALQTWLATGETAVMVPFARGLAEPVPPTAVRLRRDFGALLNLIRAHALLQQETRSRDHRGRIVATLDDYAIVRELVAGVLAEAVEATVSKAVRETVEAVAALADERGVSITRLAQALRIDKGSASRRWRRARQLGYLANLEDKKGKAVKIVTAAPLPDDMELLPTRDRLADCCTVADNTEGVPDLPPQRMPTHLIVVGDPMYPILLAEAGNKGHVTREEFSGRYVLHKLIERARETAVEPDIEL
jgi:hypothetical protein